MNNTVFAPIERDNVVGKFGIIHGCKRTIAKDALIAEVGKPFNIFEGFGKGSTLVAMSGLTFPFSRIEQFGKLAKSAQDERQRHLSARKQHVLPRLDLSMTMTRPTATEKPKARVSGRDALMQMRKRMNA